MNDRIKQLEINLTISVDYIVNHLYNKNMEFKEDLVRTALSNLKDMEILKQERFLREEQFNILQSEIVNALLMHLDFLNNWRCVDIYLKINP